MALVARTWAEINAEQEKADARALRAMKALDSLLGGTGPGQWTFDGQAISEDIASLLLILHDEITDLEAGGR